MPNRLNVIFKVSLMIGKAPFVIMDLPNTVIMSRTNDPISNKGYQMNGDWQYLHKSS